MQNREEPQPPFAWVARFNDADMTEADRAELLRVHLGSVGDGATVRPTFHCDDGGNIRLGAGVFLNFNCVILDVAPVTIGDLTAIGPAVQILTSDHPRDPDLRRRQVRYGRAVTIGTNVWIGGGAIILPGITIGDDAIIGPASVVTHDVAPGSTVIGTPARPAGASDPVRGGR